MNLLESSKASGEGSSQRGCLNPDRSDHSHLMLHIIYFLINISVSPTENTEAEVLCESGTGDQGWRVLAPSSRPPVTYTT